MEMKPVLQKMVADTNLHARLLNTLSLMENTGARKISEGENPVTVTLIILKHAAEEHRHAYYLKKQIARLGDNLCPDYSHKYLLAPVESRQYLHQLDLDVCRYLKRELSMKGADLRFAAYLLVTYAIEVRADGLYPVYQEVLDEAGSKVNVKSIILEEEGHLEEMLHQLKNHLGDWQQHADAAVKMEEKLFNEWMLSLNEVKLSAGNAVPSA